MRKALLIISFVLAFLPPAVAQQQHGFTPCLASAGAQTISASNISSGVTLSSCGPNVIIFNISSQEAFYNLSSTDAAATTSDYSIPGNSYINLVVPNAGVTYYLTAITAANTTTLRISQGTSQ